MKFIVGLGNPGNQYDKTRHNVGFDVVDRIARQIAPGEPATSKFDSVIIETRFEDEKVYLMKPQKFMNRSGHPIKQAIEFYKANPNSDLLVISDDIHLPCGSKRMKNSGSAGGHNGLTDILTHFGNDNWARLRIGVDEPGQIPQSDYVLGKFTPEQWGLVEPTLEAATVAAKLWITHGPELTMNSCNETDKPENARNQ